MLSLGVGKDPTSAEERRGEDGRRRRSTAAGEAVAAFIPNPRPPADPPLALDSLRDVLSRIEHALARLDLAGEMVPSLDWFRPRRRRFELPLGRASSATRPGERVEVVADLLDVGPWLCGVRAPPPEEVPRLLGDLERYIHAEDSLPPLVRAGLVHVQFESIHPYLDGNGRVGRLLIALSLEHWNLLHAPLLYVSLHFKRRRRDHYRLLNDVRRTGDWEGWTRFFLEGVAGIAEESATTARDLYRLVTRDRDRVLTAKGSSLTAVRLLDVLPRRPVVTIPGVVTLLETTKPTSTKSIELLETLGILEERTGRKRDRTPQPACRIRSRSRRRLVARSRRSATTCPSAPSPSRRSSAP